MAPPRIRAASAASTRACTPVFSGRQSRSRTVPPRYSSRARRASAQPSASLSGVIRATASGSSDSRVTVGVPRVRVSHSAPRSAGSTGASTSASVPRSTSRRRSSFCSSRSLSAPGVRNRSSAPRSPAACSIPRRVLAQRLLSALRIRTETSTGSRLRSRPSRSGAARDSSTAAPSATRMASWMIPFLRSFTSPPPSDRAATPPRPVPADGSAPASPRPARSGWSARTAVRR